MNRYCCDKIEIKYYIFIGDKSKGENSVVVSMDINGIMYQGVLFAQDRSTPSSNMNSRNSS